MTDEEQEVMNHLKGAIHGLKRLEEQHPDERRDFADGIHKCQSVIALRVARRAEPENWPTYIKGSLGWIAASS